LSTHHLGLKKTADTVAGQLTQAASTGSPAVKSAVSTYVTDLKASAAAGNVNVAKLTADGNAVVAVCAVSLAPKGDPATGGGSTAAIRDPALYGLGGAAVLAGIVVLGLALRNRLAAGVGQG
jgi:hypothetical protein